MAPGPLAAALQGHDMFLYFGHGSGDQYLSARYRATDCVIFDYQMHALHSSLLLKEQCCANEQPNCCVFLIRSQQRVFAVISPMRSPRSWIACQARNAYLHSHVFGVSSIDAVSK